MRDFHHPNASERIFVWIELALSGLLVRMGRLRRTIGQDSLGAPR